MTPTERMRAWRAAHPERAREGNQRRYQRNKDEYKRRANEAYQRKREFLDALKLELGCAECGYDENAAALQFHHRDPAEKVAPVTTVAANSSWQAMEDEIAKCDVLCANCHAIHHYS